MVRCRGLLVQFGIAADPAQQLKWNVPIKDDRAIGSLRFKRGTLSFAGMGPNTRTTNLFLAERRILQVSVVLLIGEAEFGTGCRSEYG